MTQPLYDYVVPEPSVGKLTSLLPSNVINAKQIGYYPPDTGVVRWSKSSARTAERIARREFERYGGHAFAEGNIPAIQQLVAVVALDPCGTFSAMLSTDNWYWGMWAKFCYVVASMTPEQYLQLIANIVTGNCQGWNVLTIYDEGLPDPYGYGSLFDTYYISFDPWYQIPYVYQLADSGPYAFMQGPVGFEGTYFIASWAMPPTGPVVPPETPPGETPPGSLPPGETLPPGSLPPGETPPDLPNLPPGEQPPAVEPVGVKEDKKTSDTAIVLGVLGGVAALGLLGWAVTRRKANPAGYSGYSGYTRQEVWDFYLQALRRGDVDAALLWYDEYLAKKGCKHSADTAMMTAGRAAPSKAPRAGKYQKNPVPSEKEQEQAWAFLTKQLKKSGLPTSKHTYRTNVDPDEFMLMGIDGQFFMFKHRGTRNYLGIDRKSGKLVTFFTGEPFFMAHYDENPVTGNGGLQVPERMDVLFYRGNLKTFTAVTTKDGDTLSRRGDVLKRGSIGTLVPGSVNEKTFYQMNHDVTSAMYKVPGYRYPVMVWWDNATGRRLA